MFSPEVGQNLLDGLPSHLEGPRFTVLGIGGAGIRVLRNLEEEEGCRKVAVDTDDFFLALSACPDQIDIGLPEFRGRGTGGEAERGRAAAVAHETELGDRLEGDILLLAAGLGGGTGAGAAPVIADLARDKGIPVLAFLIWPFRDEDLETQAERAFHALRERCTAYLILDNETGLSLAPAKTDAKRTVNTMVARTIEGLVHSVSDAFPFALHDEVRDYLAGLPATNVASPFWAGERDEDLDRPEPVATDSRGRIDVR